MTNKKPGSRTLLVSIICSSPGPITAGLSLLLSNSSTQLAEFVRRAAELTALIMSYVTYQRTAAITDADVKKQRERTFNLFVGSMMCLAGMVMLVLSFLTGSRDKGNVLPGLLIALVGVGNNGFFWLKFRHMHRQTPNTIMAVQSRLYFAKWLVDTCVACVLLCLMLMPDSIVAFYLDAAGSAFVALYMVLSGIRTMADTRKQ